MTRLGFSLGLLTSVVLVSCASAPSQPIQISEVYVADFKSDDIKTCRPSDVNLNHERARAFFLRAREVDSKTLHDHYDWAPCYVEGTLKLGAQRCDWQIRAGATGQIDCGKEERYFVCDSCDDLLSAP